MPRWTTSAWSSPLGPSRVSHRYLPRRSLPVIRASEQPRGQVGGAGLVAAHGAGMVHADGGDGLAHHVGLQSAPHHLDLG